MSKKSKKTEAAEATKITVPRNKAVELLTDLGFKDICKADNATMTRRLGKMKMYLESFDGTLNGDMKKLADSVVAAGKDNVVIEGEEPKTKGVGKEKKAKGAGKEKKVAGKPKEKAGVDQFGSRVGTVRAKVNAMLSKKKALTMAIIREKLGGPCNESYLKGLVERKIAVKTDKGYMLK